MRPRSAVRDAPGPSQGLASALTRRCAQGRLAPGVAGQSLERIAAVVIVVRRSPAAGSSEQCLLSGGAVGKIDAVAPVGRELGLPSPTQKKTSQLKRRVQLPKEPIPGARQPVRPGSATKERCIEAIRTYLDELRSPPRLWLVTARAT